MRVVSNEHASEVQLLDLARLQRSTLDRWLGICIGTNEPDAAAYVRAAIAIKSTTERKAA